ncbi:glutamate synthase large subunit [Dyella caseinilytica]|uniref:Glutamate synthase large subunit n=1 Tax=Dyella caseinilytica TaxID=1849581 RepID=A0ABX7GUX2_9GAMM|nr:glutamate synthase large subunit [Dyella caseinilytica]QRN54090.1 glutamate synthase large subunit [Dyella caseinilytica]GFZ91521.1 glutamate synthase large subunit [Dyella caseinilytica]
MPVEPRLYDASFEHDSCGFGLVAQIDGRASKWVVDTAFAALAKLSHRGGVNADGISGDGCGVLIHHPQAWLRALAVEAGIALSERFAAGLVFLDTSGEDAARVLEQHIAAEGLRVAGWRDVAVNPDACGPLAAAARPHVRQIFVNAAGDMDDAAFDRALFRARRRAETALSDDPQFYVVSLSAQVIGYKAMAAPGHLRNVFDDLHHPALVADAVVFHQRFSTNTTPQWRLAQPFRLLAHNGEINTIRANRRWMQTRAEIWRSQLVELGDIGPFVRQTGSDSESLDNALELLLAGGLDLIAAMRVLVPPAFAAREGIDEDLAAFYEYYALHMEPWDGPAGLVMCDGRYAACTLDRNGLRPARWALSDDNHLIVASEAGLWDVPSARVIAKGRLAPGEMIAVDFATHRLLRDADIDQINRKRAPYRDWLRAGVSYLESDLIDPSLAAEPLPADELRCYQKLYGLSREERETVLKVIAELEAEATGSMGDDTPIAAMSRQVRPLFDRFRQAFAQVTNPPIDPLREKLVMSLVTQIGPEGNVFELKPENAQQILINSPILSQRKLRQLLAMPQYRDAQRFDLMYAAEEGLEAALRRLCREVAQTVRDGCSLVFISDRYPQRDRLPIQSLLATGAIHAYLIDQGLRCQCNIVVETAAPRDPHQFACLIGFGATAIYPWLAYQSLFELGREGHIEGDRQEIGRSYRRGIRKGLLKILSKMGISTVAGYRGAQLFEIVGLAPEVVELCFPGTPSRIGGAGFAELEHEQRLLAAEAWNEALPLRAGGLYKYVHGGEYHMYNPDVIASLQKAVRTGNAADYRVYADFVDRRPSSALRDLLGVKPAAESLSLEAVEPVESILKRFDSAGMSLGALSPEAHEALAIAMNRLGARSNSGEGGEDPARYGTERASKIKQVASGRFGVTPAYLVNAEVLQIKIAQGAKPGEGGQLPGHKVDSTIARLRYAKPGIGLISPPPHHDIYSIEDLAELIHDLKEVNPDALVSVKLVSHAGVGTVAAGVVKAGADLITVSGHDGGTGASPLTSIKYAGTPWELGLAETQQTLRRNDLRGRVRLQTDGGLKTGLDVIKAALLGAESFGFGTGPMVALGCKYLRICHLNNCATGVATQHPVLRKDHFIGLPEMVMNYFTFVAQDVRQHLAQLGVSSLGEIVGRTDLLEQLEGGTPVQHKLDLTPLIDGTGLSASSDVACTLARNPMRDEAELASRIATDTLFAVANKAGGSFSYPIVNTDRAIGARLSGEVARRHGDHGMDVHPIELKLEGAAGQSLGAWNAGGVHIELIGEANDGVGKGMAGGRIVVRPPADAPYASQDAAIIGNTCLYGATDGELYAAGRAGERFAVRNSGALAVVEGAGDHCCEYMTGGVVAVLGKVGLNFGAGMTGGFAYVLDLERDFVDCYNHELVDILRISPEGMENYMQHLRRLVTRHVELTGSDWGRQILRDFRGLQYKFWLVKPKAANLAVLAEELRRAA